MADSEIPTRAARRDASAEEARPGAERRRARQLARERASRDAFLKKATFGGVVVAVLAIGGFLAFGDFFARGSSGGTGSGAIDVQSSMAGFTPSEIRVKAGETVTLRWWTQDAAIHLENGVHTMVAPDLALREELPAESTRLVTWTVPDKPGTYDVYCESCCGGKDSPTMHGKIVVEPASAAAAGRVGA
jgi:plastocyanin